MFCFVLFCFVCLFFLNSNGSLHSQVKRPSSARKSTNALMGSVPAKQVQPHSPPVPNSPPKALRQLPDSLFEKFDSQASLFLGEILILGLSMHVLFFAVCFHL